MNLTKMSEALHSIRNDIGKKEMPIYWLEFILLVYKSGEDGITTIEASNSLGMTQGIASRMVKLMSKYHNPKTKESDGLDILETKPDLKFRHRQRVVLTEKGKEILKRAESYIS